MLSIKKVDGNGDAVRIENSGSGTGLNIVQKGNALAAKFSGGSGVEIENKLFVKTSNGAVNKNGVEGSNETPAESQPPDESLYVRPLVHLRLNKVIAGNYLVDSSGNSRGGTVQGSLKIIDDDKFGKCLNFDGSPQNYVILPKETIPIGNQATFSFWAWGANTLPAQTCLIHAKDNTSERTESNRNRVLLIHLPWIDNNIYFDCGNNGTGFDRISRLAEPDDFKGCWIHWAFTKDATDGVMKIYKDGTEWHSGNQKSYQLSEAIIVTLGRNDPSEANSVVYQGKLAHFRSYNRVLSARQIQWQKDEDEDWRLLEANRVLEANRRREKYELQKMQDAVSSPIRFEAKSSSSGMSVTQDGDGLAALFKGGSGVEITGNLQVGQRIRDKTGEIMPVGAVLPFAGAFAPEGWLLCNGQRVNDPKYADLAAILGQTLPFNVPNYGGKFIAGATETDDYKLGALGGKESVQLTEDQMPIHGHGNSLSIAGSGDHSHSVTIYKDVKGSIFSQPPFTNIQASQANSDPRTVSVYGGTHDHRIQGSISQSGGGYPHENRPPFVALNYIIKY